MELSRPSEGVVRAIAAHTHQETTKEHVFDVSGTFRGILEHRNRKNTIWRYYFQSGLLCTTYVSPRNVSGANLKTRFFDGFVVLGGVFVWTPNM